MLYTHSEEDGHASRDLFSMQLFWNLLEPLRTTRIAAVRVNKFQSHMTYDACPTSSDTHYRRFAMRPWVLLT